MPCYDDAFLQAQIGRSIALHFEPPDGMRRSGTVKHGFLASFDASTFVVRVHGEEYPVHVARMADQPAHAERNWDGGSVWWEWKGAERAGL